MRVSVRELKNHLSKYLRSVASGKPVIVTSHSKPVARLSRVPGADSAGLSRLLEEGLVVWNGNKPRGLSHKDSIRLRVRDGKTMADLVLEDRR